MISLLNLGGNTMTPARRRGAPYVSILDILTRPPFLRGRGALLAILADIAPPTAQADARRRTRAARSVPSPRASSRPRGLRRFAGSFVYWLQVHGGVPFYNKSRSIQARRLRGRWPPQGKVVLSNFYRWALNVASRDTANDQQIVSLVSSAARRDANCACKGTLNDLKNPSRLSSQQIISARSH